ncbi:MAG: MBL fold metallo-hydrolase [Eubacteriales bacterium]|nr:MBL fold metallo-hydrolase [Eubacteriales bacterium]
MKRIISLLLIALCVLGLWGCTIEDFTTTEAPAVTVGSLDGAGLNAHFIDVGQGDSILLESKGEYALVDAGEYPQSETVISYLNKTGVKKLNYVFSTHPHSDHCGGLGNVIKSFTVDAFVSPEVQSDSAIWEYTLDAVDEKQLTYIVPNSGDSFPLGEATITVLSPGKNSLYSNMNDYSLVCKVSYKGTSVLLTGDAEETVERELLRSDFDLRSDVLKCGHHGSSSSTCLSFLKEVNPSLAIISCGVDNEYGHPHKETVKNLDGLNIPCYRTDLSGNIVVSANGEEISVSTDSSKTEIPKASQQSGETATVNAGVSEDSYIGNKNSKVFHRTNCSSVESTKEKNKVYFDSRQEAADSGYRPCNNCNP